MTDILSTAPLSDIRNFLVDGHRASITKIKGSKRPELIALITSNPQLVQAFEEYMKDEEPEEDDNKGDDREEPASEPKPAPKAKPSPKPRAKKAPQP